MGVTPFDFMGDGRIYNYASIKDDKVMVHYNEVSSNGEYITDIEISEQKTKEITLVSSTNTLIANAKITDIITRDSILVIQNIDTKHKSNVDELLYMLKEGLKLESSNYADYQAAQRLIISSVNLKKLIVSYSQNVIKQVNSMVKLIEFARVVSSNDLLYNHIMNENT